MSKIIAAFLLLMSVSFRANAVEPNGFSLAGGLGFNNYVNGGSGSFGQGFLNALYTFSPWEVGVAYQAGTLSQFAVEADYLIQNFYIGIQGGPINSLGNTGVGAGPLVGVDWPIGGQWYAGGVVIYQWLTWNSGTSNTGATSSAILSPYAVLTYQF